MRALKEHVYEIPGILNLRDMGGYTAKDGRVTAKGRFIRSAGLSGSGEAGAAGLIELGVDCVIDLRSDPERDLFLRDTYGDFEDYFRTIGVTSRQIDKITAKLFD